MRSVYFVGAALMLTVCAGAETYTWTDESGTFNFTDDISNVPVKYRKNIGTREDAREQPAARKAETGAAREKAALPAAKAAGGGKQDPADDGLFDGKKPEVWQQQMQPLYAEVKRLEQQLDQLKGLMRKPVGISKERFDGLPQEFKETQKQYNEALKKYNDLNDAANKVGLPGEFRK